MRDLADLSEMSKPGSLAGQGRTEQEQGERRLRNTNAEGCTTAACPGIGTVTMVRWRSLLPISNAAVRTLKGHKEVESG